MKKTSLMLAVGALLYGTSGTYAMADVISIEEATQILSNLVIEPVNEPAENEDVGSILGTDPFTIPDYVTIDDSSPIYRTKMCDESFQVDGGEMAKFRVTVTFGDGGTETVDWEINPASPIQVADPPTETEFTGGWARGTGWLLAETGDTWYTTSPWVLYTDTNVTITKIRLEPINPIRNGGLSYAFDIGGKERYTEDAPEHTIGSSNGRVITMKSPPSPRPLVKFKATYSNPVYIDGHVDVAGKPHDLYGTLEIQFVNNQGNNIAIGGATAIDVVDFAYLADTDCLPVTQILATSNETGFDITLTGEGLMVVGKACDDGTTGSYAYDVPRDNLEISVPSTALTAGCCYSFTDENGSEIPLEVDGEAMSAYCR